MLTHVNRSVNYGLADYVLDILPPAYCTTQRQWIARATAEQRVDGPVSRKFGAIMPRGARPAA
jgi:hypothetical protein